MRYMRFKGGKGGIPGSDRGFLADFEDVTETFSGVSEGLRYVTGRSQDFREFCTTPSGFQ